MLKTIDDLKVIPKITWKCKLGQSWSQILIILSFLTSNIKLTAQCTVHCIICTVIQFLITTMITGFCLIKKLQSKSLKRCTVLLDIVLSCLFYSEMFSNYQGLTQYMKNHLQNCIVWKKTISLDVIINQT